MVIVGSRFVLPIFFMQVSMVVLGSMIIVTTTTVKQDLQLMRIDQGENLHGDLSVIISTSREAGGAQHNSLSTFFHLVICVSTVFA